MLTVQNHRGFALQDVVVMCSCVAILVVLATVVCASPQDALKRPGPRNDLSFKDQMNLLAITRVFTIFAAQNKGRFPIPGLINRHAADLDGDGKGDAQLVGVGPENIELNITANLFSALIAQRYFNPDILISPIERNKKVKEDSDYNFDAYDPAEDVLWDSNFVADLEKLSNTSYAHIPISGQRKMRVWKFNEKSPKPILSNRGPKDGKADPKSNTCGPHGYWHGHVAFSDGHIEFLSPTAPYAVPVIRIDEVKMDNIFADDDLGGENTVLAVTKCMTNKGPELQYD